MTIRLEVQLKEVFNTLELEYKNIDNFVRYLEILSRWNKNINLISKKENNIIGNLLAPSLLFFKLAGDCYKKRVVDLGSGAGFPAIVIKIYNPSIDIAMIEKNTKKAAFLHYISLKLGLNTKIIEKNIFDVGENQIEMADIVTVRGLSITEKLIETIRIKTRSRRLVYFTSPKIRLPLALIKKIKLNSISAQLYEL